MNFIVKAVSLLIYPLSIIVRIVNALIDNDPLRLRRQTAESYWIVRHSVPSRPSYFSEASEVEGRRRRGPVSLLTKAIRLLARLFVPPRSSAKDEKFRPAAERERGIPDEVYTLW
ncbi:MAG: hypothetical protein DMG05_09205 [Acidobacteria bacterium]|nr:MAG: hypothetical protein DMG05_09205 [Acidobacteriota bacterium]